MALVLLDKVKVRGILITMTLTVVLTFYSTAIRASCQKCFFFPINVHADDIFGMDTLTLTDGFLGNPEKTDGNIRLINVTDWDAANVYILTPPHETRWFYHNAIWKDMDGDGLKDCVTCGANVPLTGEGPCNQLLWLSVCTVCSAYIDLYGNVTR